MSHISSIKNYWGKIKPHLVIINFALIAVLSFGLGRLSQTGKIKESMPISVPAQIQVQVSAGGNFVGSKNGTKYHYPWCSGAARIKEENKVWFQTVDEAKRAGYSPAANCPGL